MATDAAVRPARPSAAGALEAERERRRALETELAMLRRIMDESQEAGGFGCWQWDIASDAISWTSQMYEILDFDGTSPPSIAAFMDRVHPEDRSDLEADMATLMKAGPRKVPRDYRIIRRDGKVRWIHGVSIVQRDHQGQALRIHGVVQDITQARADQRRFERLVEAAPDAMVVADADGVITLANAQAHRLFAYEKGELRGLRVEDLIPQSRRSGHAQHRADYAAAPKMRPMGSGMDLQGVRKDGVEIPVEISLSPIKTDEGLLVVAAIRDITERRKAAEADRVAFERLLEIEQLKEIDRFKTQVLSTTSHELKTPLTPVRLQLYMLRSGRLGDLTERQEAALGIVHRNVERLGSLVGDILEVARLQAGRLKLSLGDVDLAGVINEAVGVYKATAADDGVQLVVGDVAVDTVRADADRLAQVLDNLLSNAVKFSPKGATVTLSVHDEGETLHIEVEDQGRGLDPEEIDVLFQPFSQVRADDDPQQDGTGLGLFICKGIIERHGGKIGIRSDGRGHGSTFWFTLPRQGPTEDDKRR